MCVIFFFVVCVNTLLKFEQKKMDGEKKNIQYSLSTGVYPSEVQTWGNQAIKLFHLKKIILDSILFILF